MKQSQLFTKTRKEAPKDEESKNAQLLIRAGYIHKEMAGVYSMLPLGLLVMNKIANIVREEMNAIGGQEVSLSALQDRNLWEKTNRWDDEVVDNWFKTKLKNDNEIGFGFTHEEPITLVMKDHIHSYKDLPRYPYQVQTKFRNELRAKSGIMRGREFLMKDLYSFSRNQEEHDMFYDKAKEAYFSIFNRVGLGDKTYITFASGGSFSQFSHEFQTLSGAGEDIVYVDKEKKIALNKEVYSDEIISQLGLNKSELVEEKAIEVGNIFSLGTKFSDALELTFDDEVGKKQKVIMGSYGIGIGRLMGVISETLSDEKGIVWPESVSPFDFHIISLNKNTEAEDLYNKLIEKGKTVLLDDREKGAGEKFADADLIGITKQIVVSQKTLDAGKFEVKNRKTGEVTHLSESDILA